MKNPYPSQRTEGSARPAPATSWLPSADVKDFRGNPLPRTWTFSLALRPNWGRFTVPFRRSNAAKCRWSRLHALAGQSGEHFWAEQSRVQSASQSFAGSRSAQCGGYCRGWQFLRSLGFLSGLTSLGNQLHSGIPVHTSA